MTGWGAADIPDQTGRVALVTGANSGLGFQTSRQLAAHGARVVLGCRNEAKARAAAHAILAEHPHADLDVLDLDLASLDSVRRAADTFGEQHERLDVLVNNAGLMAIPRQLTDDGFEMQLGVNHLGHFALTGLLLDPLLATEGSRVVNVSSGAHQFGKISDDLMGERRYGRWAAYGQSKLANLLFTLELQRRLDKARESTIAVAAHPGAAATNLQAGPLPAPLMFLRPATRAATRLIGQSDAMGALPQLYAATAPDVVGGAYYGPDGPMEVRGHPTLARTSARANDAETARTLWARSEELTGVTYDALPG